MEAKTFSSSHQHFLSSRPVLAIQFPFRFGVSSSSMLSHRAIQLRPISAVKPSKKIKKIGSEISSLTLEESRILVDYLHDKFGVSLVFSSSAAPAVEEEQTEVFDVVINEVPSSFRISVIKAIRAHNNWGLQETKELIEGLPKKFKESVMKDEAEEAKKLLEEAGAKVSIMNHVS